MFSLILRPRQMVAYRKPQITRSFIDGCEVDEIRLIDRHQRFRNCSYCKLNATKRVSPSGLDTSSTATFLP
jgi:hypothetical protein